MDMEQNLEHMLTDVVEEKGREIVMNCVQFEYI